MRVLFFIFFVWILNGCANIGSEKTELPQYGWEERPNFSLLRDEWGAAEDFFQRCESGRPVKTMVEAMNKKDWPDAIRIGEEGLRKCPVDMRVHYYTGIALAESGDEISAENHFSWAKGLMDALVASGDGKTPETAYVTISVVEEYDALYFFGLQAKKQSLISGDITCDLIVATNDKGDEFSIYFNPSAHFIRLNKMLSE